MIHYNSPKLDIIPPGHFPLTPSQKHDLEATPLTVLLVMLDPNMDGRTDKATEAFVAEWNAFPSPMSHRLAVQGLVASRLVDSAFLDHAEKVLDRAIKEREARLSARKRLNIPTINEDASDRS